MLVNAVVMLVLLAAVGFFGWLAVRAWRARRLGVKIPGVLLAGLLGLVCLALLVVGAKGYFSIYMPRATAAPELSVDVTPARVERGRYLADSFCVECHSTTAQMPMTGGIDFANDIPVPLGSMVSQNLTPAGVLKNYTDGELMRVFRAGIDRQGHKLAIMGAVNVRYMSDEDLHALIAFLRSQSPVEQAQPYPADRLNYLAMVMVGAGLIPSSPAVEGSIVAPAKAETSEYGAYVLSYQDCRVCHGTEYRGGTPGGLTPVGPSLQAVKGWTREQFISTLRTGVTPDGHQLSDDMPWRSAGRLDDLELSAVHAYLSSLP